MHMDPYRVRYVGLSGYDLRLSSFGLGAGFTAQCLRIRV